MLLNFVHLQVHKNIKQKSLRGFTTVLLYLLCQNGLLLVYKLKTILIFYLFLSRYLLETLTKILRFITTLIHQLSLVTSVFDPWHGITTYQWGWKSTAVRMVRSDVILYGMHHTNNSDWINFFNPQIILTIIILKRILGKKSSAQKFIYLTTKFMLKQHIHQN